MTRFRPCIDLHEGQVKQIVGETLVDGADPHENFVSDKPASWFSSLFREDGMTGGHVIMLGPGNEKAAKDALATWPGGWQLGGGINDENAVDWLEAGASHVVVTSWLFSKEGRFDISRLERLSSLVGRDRLVIDLSCRNSGEGWVVSMNRWQKPTDLFVTSQTLQHLSNFGSEFLVHAADVEGKCAGIDERLVDALGEWSPIPITYAGGARSMEDLAIVDRLSNGKVDLTIGSALDIFGGKMVCYRDCVDWNRKWTVNS
jgi:phosphoribosylformimino-5-aminoimidazole carboxamide ribotide isomerase